MSISFCIGILPEKGTHGIKINITTWICMNTLQRKVVMCKLGLHGIVLKTACHPRNCKSLTSSFCHQILRAIKYVKNNKTKTLLNGISSPAITKRWTIN